MRIAAVQMTAELADTEKNINYARSLVKQAFHAGAEWVILPEFFTTAMGYSRKMLSCALPVDGAALEMMKELSREHNGVVGGSFLSIRGMDRYNTFALVFPDGNIFYHDKDQPTMWENCYYIGGDDNGIFETPAARVGAALCWEFIRTRTANRLRGKVDLVVGGSCWWTVPDRRLPGFSRGLHKKNARLSGSAPARFARLTGVPVVHAAHAGEFECDMPLLPGFRYRSRFLGETQIVDGTGKILARMTVDDGAGFIMADIETGSKGSPREKIPGRFWIPDLPFRLSFAWWYQNLHGRFFYRLKKKKWS